MNCDHIRLRCTDGIFYCLDCGQVVEPPKQAKQDEPKETEKPKRRARKGADK